MKTIQTFALLILLFAANTYCQEYIAAEIDKGSIPTKTEIPNDLIAILSGQVGLEGVSSVLPSQDTPTLVIEVNAPESPQETISETQETSSIPIESEPSTGNPQEIPQNAAEESPSETAIPENDPQKELENDALIPEADKEAEDVKSQAPTEPIAVETVAAQENQNLEANPTDNQPEGGTELIVNNESTIAADEAETSATTESKPNPENSETVPTNSLTEENSESTSATDEVNPSAPGNSEPETENSEATPNNELPHEEATNATEEVAPSAPTDSNSETSSKPELNSETTSDLPLAPTNPNAEAENSEATASNKLPEEEVTNATVEVAPSDSKPESENSEVAPTNVLPEEAATNIAPSQPTDSKPEINTETTSESELSSDTTSNLSNPSPKVIEANEATSEPEQNITDGTIEDPSTTITPCTEVGDIPHPTNCRQYVSCSDNATNLVSQELHCPERSAFNPLVRRCTRDLSPCLNEEPICLRTSSIPNPNGENSSYFWCVPSLLGGFHKYHIQCSQNEIFTPLLGRCWVTTPLGLGLGLLNPEPSDRDLVRAEWKLLRREIKMKAKEEKLRKKLEEKAKARAEKLAAKELKKQKETVKKLDDNDSEEEDD